MITTVDRAFELMESRTNLERGGTPHLRQYRLERMAEILHRLGNPHRTLPAVHIAGTKGKGSTATFTASLLAASGFRTGLYTSPHVTGYRERFRVIPPDDETAVPHAESRYSESVAEVEPRGASSKESFPSVPFAPWTGREEAILLSEGSRVWQVVEVLQREGTPEDDLPTTFELLTALAFCFFSSAGCEIVVLETGLGGRLDATNLCSPLVTMITRIEREHQEYLGNTLQEIATEKGGIIKPGVPVIIAPQRREVRTVLTAIARQRQAPMLPVVPVRHRDRYTLGMDGAVHRVNAGHALAALRELQRQSVSGERPGATIRSATTKNLALEDAKIRRALARARLPGRGERLRGVLLDGAHTPESVAHAVRTVPGRRSTVILGVVSGKDLGGIAAALHGRVSRVIVSRPGTFKPGDPAAVYAAVAAAGLPAELLEDPVEALRRAREFREPILVTGSFYMVGEIRRLLLQEDRCP